MSVTSFTTVTGFPGTRLRLMPQPWNSSKWGHTSCDKWLPYVMFTHPVPLHISMWFNHQTCCPVSGHQNKTKVTPITADWQASTQLTTRSCFKQFFIYIYIFLPNFVTHLSITQCHFFFAFANPVYHLCQLALPTPVLGEPRLQPCCLRVITRQPAASYHMIGDSARGRRYSTQLTDRLLLLVTISPPWAWI